MARAVFLDRDGVINRAIVRDGKPYPPESTSTFEIYDGVAGALANLRKAGYLLIVVTNQPDVARQTQSRAVVEAMHAELMRKVPVDEIMVCYHDGDACDCRKPKPGALLDAQRRYDIDLKNSYMVGDRWRDIEAGQRAGCKCIFVDHGYGERQPEAPYVRVPSLVAAAELILSAVNGSALATDQESVK